MALNGPSFSSTMSTTSFTNSFQADYNSDSLGFFKGVPEPLLKQIFEMIEMPQQPQISLVCKTFYVINQELLTDSVVRKITQMTTPITLSDRKGIQTFAFDSPGNTLFYVLSKNAADVNPLTHLKAYYASSGKIESLILSNSTSKVQNIYLTPKGCLLQHEVKEADVIYQSDRSLHLNSNARLSSSKIETVSFSYTSSINVNAIHAAPNANGVSAGTYADSSNITLYNDEATILKMLQKHEDSKNWSVCRHLTLSNTHLYAVYQYNQADQNAIEFLSMEVPDYIGNIQIFSLETGLLIKHFDVKKLPSQLVVSPDNTYCIIRFLNSSLALLHLDGSMEELPTGFVPNAHSFSLPSLTLPPKNHPIRNRNSC